MDKWVDEWINSFDLICENETTVKTSQKTVLYIYISYIYISYIYTAVHGNCMHMKNVIEVF